MLLNNDMKSDLAILVTTIAEVDFAPESMLYIGFSMDLPRYELIKRLALAAGLIESAQRHALRITDKGRKLAAELNGILADAKAGAR